MNAQEIATRNERAEIAADERTTARVVESMVLRGDISGLSSEDRARFYLQMCDSLGLSAASQPFAILRLNGKEILYPTRGATDQLAAIHRLNREIVDGPKVIDVAGTKMIYALCRATHPNGRFETAVATVPATDPLNALMKCETKAKRRATLSILGLGMLDETEIETIPASVSRAHVETPVVEVAAESAPPQLPADYSADLTRIEMPAEAVSVWLKHRAYLATLSADHKEAAWKALCARTEDVGKMKNSKVWLKRAIAEEDARRLATPHPEPEPAPDFVCSRPDARDPRQNPLAIQFQTALAAVDSTDGVVAAWIEYGGRFASEGSDVLEACRVDARKAWAGYGGEDSAASLEAAIAAARARLEPVDPPARTTKRQRQAAAPLSRSVPVMTPAELAGHLALKDSAGEVAGAYWKRAGLWDEAGTLVACRTIVVDRLCALLSTDERAAYAWLDGCDPARRSERRSAETDRRQAR